MRILPLCAVTRILRITYDIQESNFAKCQSFWTGFKAIIRTIYQHGHTRGTIYLWRHLPSNRSLYRYLPATSLNVDVFLFSVISAAHAPTVSFNMHHRNLNFNAPVSHTDISDWHWWTPKIFYCLHSITYRLYFSKLYSYTEYVNNISN